MDEARLIESKSLLLSSRFGELIPANHGKEFGVNFELLLGLSNNVRSRYVPFVIDIKFFSEEKRYLLLLYVFIHRLVI